MIGLRENERTDIDREPRGQPAIAVAGVLLTACVWLGLGQLSKQAQLDLSPEARHLAVVFSIVITLWVSEIIPIAATSLAVVPMLVMFGVTTSREAIAGFASPVSMFVLSMFILAAVIRRVGLDRRLALWLLAKAGTSPNRILLAFMSGTAILSTIISDVPACAVFTTLGIGLLDRMGAKPGESVFGRSLMMGIPIAALIGGIATPAGSSINVLGMQQIDDFARQHDLEVGVSFLQWSAIGIPMAVVLVPVAWLVLVRCCPPDVLTISGTENIESDQRRLGKLEKPQILVMAMLSAMMVLWVAGNWIRWLDVTVVAMLGAVFAFLPGIRLISWGQAVATIGWDTLLMIGGVVALGQASLETGLAEALVAGSIGGVQNWSPVWIIAMISIVTVVIHLPLPIAPVVNAVLIPPVASLALHAQTGEVIHNPIMFALPVAFTASCAFLLPLDAVCLLTYSRGYYRMHDMLLPGALISVCWVIVMTVAMLCIAPLVGLI